MSIDAKKTKAYYFNRSDGEANIICQLADEVIERRTRNEELTNTILEIYDITSGGKCQCELVHNIAGKQLGFS